MARWTAPVRRIAPSPRGRAAYAKIHEILRDIECEWSAQLGARQFAQLKELLLRVWESPLTR
jgi:DNA-binding MarR family transcriptional regulator